MKTIQVKCRHGVTYSIEVKGTKGSIFRLKQMLEDCCCYVCHNHNCATAREGKQDCRKQCEFYTRTPYCEIYGREQQTATENH